MLSLFASAVSTPQALLDTLDFSGWNALLGGNDFEQEIRSIASGEFSLSPSQALRSLLDLFLGNLSSLLPVTAGLLACALVVALCRQLQQSLSSPGASAACRLCCTLVAAAPLVQMLLRLLQNASETVAKMSAFSNLLFPTLVALLAALGAPTTSGVCQTAVVAVTGVLSSGVEPVLFRFLSVMAALAILDSLSDAFSISRLRSLLTTSYKWLLGAAFVVFLGILTLQGATSGVIDGVSVRTVKYTVDTFVPVVGGMFADTVDTLVSCALVVKQAVGIGGMLAIVTLCASPCLRIFAAVLCCRFAAAVLQPMGEEPVGKLLMDFSHTLSLLGVTVMTCAAMLLVLVAAMLSAASSVVALR